jgi:hypothetical protein
VEEVEDPFEACEADNVALLAGCYGDDVLKDTQQVLSDYVQSSLVALAADRSAGEGKAGKAAAR